MGMLAEWRAARARRRLAAVYLRSLLTAVEPADVQWLTSLAGDEELARRELGFARRALALIVAERDALDDRTVSDVAHELMALTEEETRRHPELGAIWVERWKAFTEALAVRGVADAPAVRLGRVLLSGVGLGAPTFEQAARASQCVQGMRVRANEALRAAFGVASLPDDVRPSAIRS